MIPTPSGLNADPLEFLDVLKRLSRFDMEALRRNSPAVAAALQGAPPLGRGARSPAGGCSPAFQVLVSSANVVKCQAEHFAARYMEGAEASRAGTAPAVG